MIADVIAGYVVDVHGAVVNVDFIGVVHPRAILGSQRVECGSHRLKSIERWKIEWSFAFDGSVVVSAV